MTTTPSAPTIELLTTAAVAQKIRKLRDMYSYSQEYVSFHMGISVGEYIKKESARSEVTLLEMAKLAEIYNLALFDVIGLNTQELMFKALMTNAKSTY